MEDPAPNVEPGDVVVASADTISRAPMRASDSLITRSSSPSRGTWRHCCSTIHRFFSASKRLTSA